MNKPDNYSAFYGLLNRMCTTDRDALKKTIVSQYTSGRTESLKEMTMPEYLSALEGMKKLVVPTFQEQMQKVTKQKRSAVLHQMQLYGIDTTDWTRVDAFCMDSRIAGQKFKDLDPDELDVLLVKIRSIRRKKLSPG
ncbi:MAG: hypothetical protein LBT24_03630 [Tannerella sp.]|jgi:hypothetical protein|nr:hypothetical protein [Tannerella sp.]